MAESHTNEEIPSLVTQYHMEITNRERSLEPQQQPTDWKASYIATEGSLEDSKSNYLQPLQKYPICETDESQF